MSKFICVVLFAVAVSLSSIYARKEDDSADSDEKYDHYQKECMKIYGIKSEELDAMMSGPNGTSISNPCYWGCYYSKLGILNEKGQYDLNNFVTHFKQSITDDDDEIATKVEIVKQCESVKDEVVSDGETGCERGALLAACLEKVLTAMSVKQKK